MYILDTNRSIICRKMTFFFFFFLNGYIFWSVYNAVLRLCPFLKMYAVTVNYSRMLNKSVVFLLTSYCMQSMCE